MTYARQASIIAACPEGGEGAIDGVCPASLFVDGALNQGRKALAMAESTARE
jgi:hypothetical protein